MKYKRLITCKCWYCSNVRYPFSVPIVRHNGIKGYMKMKYEELYGHYEDIKNAHLDRGGIESK